MHSADAAAWTMLAVVLALVAGHGIYWFVGGASAQSSSLRQGAVCAQIVIASAAALYAERRRQRSIRNAR